MATVSAQSSPNVAPTMSETSPQLKGLKKVLSNRQRSAEAIGDEIIRDLRTGSVDSLSAEKSPTRQSARSVSQDGSSKSGSSGMRKLLPGHSKRKRRKLREEELKAAAEDIARGRTGTGLTVSSPPEALSRRGSSLAGDADTSLLTDDSEVDTPPLTANESHSGYLTMSSPLVSTTTTRTDDQSVRSLPKGFSIDNLPTVIEPGQNEGSPSPRSPLPLDTNTASSPSLGLLDRTDTLSPKSRSNSISKLRGISPARRFRDVFGKSSKSPKVSPERKSTDLITSVTSPLNSEIQVPDEPKRAEDARPISPLQTGPETAVQNATQDPSMSKIEPGVRPFTPPTAVTAHPVTTVTPPTPVESQFEESSTESPTAEKAPSRSSMENPNIVVSPSGNMISHRRIRSTPSATHQPSKLSNSMTVPATPSSESKRTPSGGIFFSWVSAAQNAATTITNLTGQSRTRSSTNDSDPSSKPKTIEEPIQEEEEASEPETPRKQLAVETLGSGDLNFEHLGLTNDEKQSALFRTDLTELRKDANLERDEAAAKVEDLLAKRAVSAAYDRPSNTSTPVAEIPDPMINLRQAPTFGTQSGGERTPPNGSVFEAEVNAVKPSNSVRSKIAAKRRSRGSSAATGQSAIVAMIGASTATLANPAKGPRLTGFTMAPKQRNRNFHQQFRSVPEDDYLIEDYSCALQKEILLAGRIYISEGHICFSSNILGWVTTVVISFEEVVSIERENTAVVFQNAIAIQTLHARHTFRSLIYREQTYDLLIGIWRVSHPASFQKSMNGKQLAAEEATGGADVVGENGVSGQQSDGSISEDSGSPEDDESAPSLVESSASNAGSEIPDVKSMTRKPSGFNASAVAQTASILAGTAGDVPQPLAAQAGFPDAANDFPGPATHGPTECSDSATHYDRVVKDEIILAPLGKIYSLLYGPESGFFVRRFLADECKCMEVVLEDDKKGLTNENKSRQYSYIKPLGGSIGPKQTKCITTENMDFFDLEKSVSVTCTTQTPDVPSGSAFSTKTRYCLTWAPGNATRFQMNSTIEWTAKSWLKGPIEKGSNEGQQQYGDTLVKVLKGAVSGRPRGTTTTSKGSRPLKKKRKGEKKARDDKVEEDKKHVAHWGVFESLRGPLTPVTDILSPVLKMDVLVAILSIMVMILWMRGPPGSSQVGPYFGLSHSQRIAAYDSLWSRQENEFWDWLEARASVDTVLLRERSSAKGKTTARKDNAGDFSQQIRRQQRPRNRGQSSSADRDVEAKMRAEKISQREMEDAIKITKERLQVLENVVEKNKKDKCHDGT